MKRGVRTISYFNIVAATNENTVVTEYTPVSRSADGYQYLKIHKESDLIDNLRVQLETLNNYTFLNIIRPYELDIYIPCINVGVEYDGCEYHKKLDRDMSKNKRCLEKGIKLFRVREYES